MALPIHKEVTALHNEGGIFLVNAAFNIFYAEIKVEWEKIYNIISSNFLKENTL